jgi:hypothetical protein
MYCVTRSRPLSLVVHVRTVASHISFKCVILRCGHYYSGLIASAAANTVILLCMCMYMHICQVYTHAPVSDIGAFAPRHYHMKQHATAMTAITTSATAQSKSGTTRPLATKLVC